MIIESNEDLELQIWGEDVSYVMIHSKPLVDFLHTKADVIDEIDDGDVEFNLCIDGDDEVTLVFYCDMPYFTDCFDDFFDALRNMLSESSSDILEDLLDEVSDIIKKDDITAIEWFYSSYFDRDNFDGIYGNYEVFEAAKIKYAFINDIDSDKIDDIDEDEVNAYIDDNNGSYFTKKYVYNKASGQDGVVDTSFEMV